MRRRIPRCTSALLVGLSLLPPTAALLATGAFAQEGRVGTELRTRDGAAPPDSARVSLPARRDSASVRPGLTAPKSELSLTRRLYRLENILTRDPERALRELETLRASHPRHYQLRLLLGRAYRMLGRLEESELVLRELEEEYPEASGFRSELVRTLLRQGRDDEALALLDRSMAAGSPRAGPYEDAAALLRSENRYGLVEGIYHRGLAALPPSDERGRLRLLRRLLDHLSLEDRPADLLRVLANEAGRLNSLQLRERLLERGRALLAEAVEPRGLLALADSLTVTESGAILAPVLRELYLVALDYDAFAERVLEAPKHAKRRPVWLYEEGVRCLETRGGDPSARRRAAETLFDAMLSLEPPADLAGRGRLQLARIRLEEDAELRLRGETPSPRETKELRALLAHLRREQPATLWAGEALVAELRLLRERLGRPAEADSLLRAWLMDPERGRDEQTQWALELQMGENLMALDRFTAARGHYTFLQKTTRSAPLQAWTRYRLAQLLILDDESAAQDSLAALAKEAPGSPLANDALDLALLLAESQTWPGAVRELIDGALRLEFSGRPAEAAERLLAFTRDFADDPAAPSLLYRAGLLLERGLRGREAVATWLELSDRHASDFRAPQGLELAARLALRMREPTLARELLSRLLEEHPDSPLRPGLRDLQEELKEDV